MKTKLVSRPQYQTALKVLVLFMLILPLTACQGLQNSAKELRSTIDQTVQNTQNKANDVKNAFQEKADQVGQTVNDVKQKVDDTKIVIDSKVQQVQEAGAKIDQAKNALNDANQAVSNLTK